MSDDYDRGAQIIFILLLCSVFVSCSIRKEMEELHKKRSTPLFPNVINFHKTQEFVP